MHDLTFSGPRDVLVDPPDQVHSIEGNSDPLDLTLVLLQQQTRISRLRKALLDVTQMCIALLDKAESRPDLDPQDAHRPLHEAPGPSCEGSGGVECEDGALPQWLKGDQLEYELPQWLREPKRRASIAAFVQRCLSEATQSNSSAILELPPKSSPDVEPPASCSRVANVKPIIILDVTSMFSCTKDSPDDVSSSRRCMIDASSQVEFNSTADRPRLSPLFPSKVAKTGHFSSTSEREQLKCLQTSLNTAQGELLVEKDKVKRLEIEQSRAFDECKELRGKLDQSLRALSEQKDRQERETSQDMEELRRLRVLMRFSELKKDSDHLTEALANLQETTQQRANLERQNARLHARQQNLQRCIEMIHAWTVKAVSAAETSGRVHPHATYWSRFGSDIVSRIQKLCVDVLGKSGSHAEGDDSSLHAAPLPGAGHAQRVSYSVFLSRRASMPLTPPTIAATELISETGDDVIPSKRSSAISVLQEERKRPELARPRPHSRAASKPRGHTRCQSAFIRW